MKVLVTGVNGQLGYDVMNELNQRGHEAIGSDITESNEHFQKYVQLDITNKEAVESEITKINPDVVVLQIMYLTDKVKHLGILIVKITNH